MPDDAGTSDQSIDQAVESAFEAAAQAQQKGTPGSDTGKSAAGAGEGDDADSDDEDGGDTAADEGDGDADDATAGDTQEEGQPDEASAKSKDDEAPELEGADEKLKELYRNLPPEIRAANHKVFGRHVQRLSEATKRADAENRAIKALREDPIGTLVEMAKEAGIEVKDPRAKQDTETAIEDITRQLASVFPEHADKLAPILRQMVDASTAPLRQDVLQSKIEAASRTIEAELDSFRSTHPDWEEHQASMLEYINRVEYKDETPSRQILEDAYALAVAKSGKPLAKAVKKTVEKMKKAAAAGSSGPKTQGTSSSRVAHKAPEFKSLDEAIDGAYDAAKRGERWE